MQVASADGILDDKVEIDGSPCDAVRHISTLCRVLVTRYQVWSSLQQRVLFLQAGPEDVITHRDVGSRQALR